MAKKLKVFTAFSGYDSQCLGLKYAKIDFDLVGWSEIDKHAILAHNALFPEYKNKNFGDIKQINPKKLPNFDLFTYSFPCKNISLVGDKKGFKKGSDTSSSLLWECEKIIKEKTPKYLILENVKGITFKNNLPYLNKWLKKLEKLGYTNYYDVLNAVDYGIPQSRERFFCVSILGKKKFNFTPPQRLKKLSIKDIVEEKVDKSFYNLSSILTEFTQEFKGKSGLFFLCPMFHHEVFEIKNFQPRKICNTIVAKGSCGKHDKVLLQNKKVRYLTPLEKLRLMGVRDADAKKMIKIVPKTKISELAGNSIVVNVLMGIYQNLFK